MVGILTKTEFYINCRNGGKDISHFHPDHMGIAQEIADYGPVIVITDFQKNYVHSSDGILTKDSKKDSNLS